MQAVTAYGIITCDNDAFLHLDRFFSSLEIFFSDATANAASLCGCKTPYSPNFPFASRVTMGQIELVNLRTWHDPMLAGS
jgi:hypothetical protein